MEPIVIGPQQHPIREKDIEREALKVLYRLRDAGFSGYLVGGGVRDLYLGNIPKDFDISTDARPGQLRKIFRNSRTIGRRFRLVQVFFRGNKIIEVSTLRSLSEHDLNGSDAVLPSNNTFGTLEEDAFRRDLTINSLFFEIDTGSIIDYVGGVADLDAGVVRMVGDPDRRITRDPVRMMRAIRHAARNDFEVESETWRAIRQHRDKIALCPPSRIRDELLKDLQSGSAQAWGALAMKSLLFYSVVPFYAAVRESKEVVENLQAVFRVLDRLHTSGKEVLLPDTMLFALLLFPYLDKELDLSGRQLKGGAYQKLSVAVRKSLDSMIGLRFNLKRMTKDRITGLLVNLVTFGHYAQKGWPRWLERKSYFEECRKFYALIKEIRGGEPADTSWFAPPRSKDPVLSNDFHKNRGKKSRSRGRRGYPAFSRGKKGVFGLKRG